MFGAMTTEQIASRRVAGVELLAGVYSAVADPLPRRGLGPRRWLGQRQHCGGESFLLPQAWRFSVRWPAFVVLRVFHKTEYALRGLASERESP